MIGPFDPAALIFPWIHEDVRVDALARAISDLVQRGDSLKLSRTAIFQHILHAATAAVGAPRTQGQPMGQPARVPFLDEPWYCCAEPMDQQFVSIGKVKAPFSKADQFA